MPPFDLLDWIGFFLLACLDAWMQMMMRILDYSSTGMYTYCSDLPLWFRSMKTNDYLHLLKVRLEEDILRRWMALLAIKRHSAPPRQETAKHGFEL